MNYFIRIGAIALFVSATAVATVKTVTILHNNQVIRNKIAEQNQVLAGNQSENPASNISGSGTHPVGALPKNTTTSKSTAGTSGTASTVQNTNTVTQVALHNKSSNCWIIINSKIYNVTSFLNQHPGGASTITPYCGKEATEAFQTHGHSGGSNHSAYAYSLLTSYFVAPLSSGTTAVAQTTSSSVVSQTKPVVPSVFSIGARVQIGSAGIVNVRTTANGALAGKQDPGSIGTITAGPTTTGGYTWWKVNFDTGVDGWVAQTFLVFGVDPVVVVQPGSYLLSIAKSGTGSGTVSGTSIDCGSICSASYKQGTVVTLSASAIAQSTFGGWSGACSGTGSCKVTMSTVKSVTATFTSTVQIPTSGYTPTDVAAHATQSNCWLIISNKVYDVTNFITSHPGGASAITTRCGTDATTVFTQNVSGGHAHSAYANSLLATYYIGDVGAAVVVPSTYLLSVSKSGLGTGTVSGGGISCGSTCSVTANTGTIITLTASAGSNSTFSGWSGSCTGTGTCSLTMNAIKSVTATFASTVQTPIPTSGYTPTDVAAHATQSNCWLIISNKVYDVTNFITSHPGGASAITTRCGTDATTVFTQNVSGGHAHSAYANSLLATYYIGDLNTTPPVAGTFLLSVSKSGTGTGTVSGSSVSCGNTCSLSYTDGTTVSLTATPATGSTFGGWTGACSGTGACNLTMNAAKSVGAIFTSTATSFSLSVSSSNGTVTSNPAGISCGTTCSATFAAGSSVVLSATPTSGYTFSGWSGSCSGTGTCSLTMNANASVSANFTVVSGGVTYTAAQIATHNVQSNCWLLISNKVYNVTNFITSHPGGVSAITTRCGTDATTVFTKSGGGGHAHSASANSLLATYYIGDLATVITPPPAGSNSLTVSKSGTGSGTVTGGGISCGTTCSVSATTGTSITLTASPATGSTFGGWTGACSGTGSCSVTLSSNQSVGATFTSTGGGTGGATTYTVNVNNAGNYDVTNLTIKVGDSIRFVYTPPYGSEVVTRFTPSGTYRSTTLDNQNTSRTRTFNTAGTWTFKADNYSGNQGTLVVQ